MWTSRAGDGYYSLTAHFNAKRSSLEPENVEKIVFLHDNLPPVPLPYKRTSNKSDMPEEPSEIDYNYSND